MPHPTAQDALVSLDVQRPIWNRFFTVAPLVIVGTREPDGTYDLAPKHMATPMGWDNYFGFVCTPRHGTYRNAKQTGTFTVSYPRPSQVVVASLAATPRCKTAPEEAASKPVVDQLPTFPASTVDGRFVDEGYLFLGCELERVVDGFGENSLIVGRVVEAHAHEDALRVSEREDADVVRAMPLLAYLAPGLFARIREAQAFPFPEGFTR